MASLTERIRKILRRKPKQQRPGKRQPRPNSMASQNGQNGQHQQQQPLANDGAADDDFRTAAAPVSATRSGQLQIALRNETQSNNVYAYITGSAINNGNALFLLSANGRTPYYPPNPSSVGTRVAQDISIRLGPPGSTVTATIPRLAGGRIWFSVGKELVFSTNPGPGRPGLIEPSVSMARRRRLEA